MKSASEHFVQFYENGSFLIEELTNYIEPALVLGNKVIVIATKAHLESLEENLKQCRLFTDSESENYQPIDANKILSKFMIDNVPDETLFLDVIGRIISKAAIDHNGKIFVFSEMVAILCGKEYKAIRMDNKHEAAIQIEIYFNKLLKLYSFELLCGYPINTFPRESDAKSFHKVCSLHSSVIPTEEYSALTSIDILQRSIASLQQKAYSLVTEVNERLLLEQLLKEVNFDRLTGLPNRSVFLDRLQMEIRKAHRANLSLALFFIDLDHFKEVNDTLGHPTGDALLKQVAQRLLSSVREIDTVARLGGDEFTIILSEIYDISSVNNVIQSILQKLTKSFRLGFHDVDISASIGITFCPEDATSVSDLIRNADQAMYASKDLGRNRVTFFTKSMQEAAQKRMKLTRELQSAIRGKQFRLLYQPIINLASGEIQKAEALLRWQHPLNGLIEPSEFIPIAERSRMIVDIGDWVFSEAVTQVTRWRKYDANFQISVNVSPAQFYKNKYSQLKWSELLKNKKLEKGSTSAGISLEITEGLLLDASSQVNDKLLEFHDTGIQVALDDFGTGYSSLSYLRKFKIDYLKIDQSFVLDLDTKPDHLAVCEAIIVMAHKLGLQVIAEGVENRRQYDLLRSFRCDFAQGYFFSKPLTADEFESILR